MANFKSYGANHGILCNWAKVSSKMHIKRDESLFWFFAPSLWKFCGKYQYQIVFGLVKYHSRQIRFQICDFFRTIDELH